jgi:protein CpxP
MRNFKTTLLIGLATLSLGAAIAPAQAQTAEGRHTHAARLEKMQANHAARFTEHMAKLHDALKLTPAQEPAWTTFMAAMTPAAHATVDRAALANLSAPERMEKHIAMAKTRIAAMEAHLGALKTFYATLTAEQKKTFDDNAKAAGHGQHMRQMMMKKQ